MPAQSRTLTIMLSDMVEFTSKTSRMSREGMMEMLRGHDELLRPVIRHHSGRVVKTIGDAYMVAGGLNNQRSDYSDALVDMALEMRDLLQHDFQVNQLHLEVRIGLGTGPVVAGVVGKKKFIYDL